MNAETLPVKAESRALITQDELSVDQVVELRAKIENTMKALMVDGRDYGQYPGFKKPALLQPGAEKLMSVFRLTPCPDRTKIVEEKEGEHYTYHVTMPLIHGPSGIPVGLGTAVCSTLEKKYVTATDRDDVPIRPADQRHTVKQMAVKRAKVAAVRGAVAASDLFEQDIDESGIRENCNRGGNSEPVEKWIKEQPLFFKSKKHVFCHPNSPHHHFNGWTWESMATAHVKYLKDQRPDSPLAAMIEDEYVQKSPLLVERAKQLADICKVKINQAAEDAIVSSTMTEPPSEPPVEEARVEDFNLDDVPF
jgi:hypothetical protein